MNKNLTEMSTIEILDELTGYIESLNEEEITELGSLDEQRINDLYWELAKRINHLENFERVVRNAQWIDPLAIKSGGWIDQEMQPLEEGQ